jgi:hypothetical protein
MDWILIALAGSLAANIVAYMKIREQHRLLMGAAITFKDVITKLESGELVHNDKKPSTQEQREVQQTENIH